MNLSNVLTNVYDSKDGWLYTSRFDSLILGRGINLPDERYLISNIVNNEIAVPLREIPATFTSYIFPYTTTFIEYSVFNTSSNAIIHSFSYTYKKSGLCQVEIESIENKKYLIGRGCIFEDTFKPLVISEDIYKVKHLPEDIIPFPHYSLDRTVVKIDKSVYADPKQLMNKFIINKFIPELSAKSRITVEGKYPIVIEISDISKEVVSPKLIITNNISEDINKFLSEHIIA